MIRGLLVFSLIPLDMLRASLAGYAIAWLVGSPSLLYVLGGFGVALRLAPSRTRIQMLDPAEVGSYSYYDRDRLIAEVRGRIAGALAR